MAGIDDATRMLQETMPLAKTLGLLVIGQDPQAVHLRLEWSDALTGAGVGLHGGTIMALADSAGGLCGFLNLPEGSTGTTTIESKTNFLRAVRAGHVDAISRPLHVGRSVIVVETEVLDEQDRRVAKVTQSQIVLRG